MNTPIRKSALRRYLVFRVKAIEMMDLNILYQAVASGKMDIANPAGRLPQDFSDSLRTPLLSWFALLIDNDGLDVIELWAELFPRLKNDIETTRARIQPAWQIIREFRDRAGFHTDKPRPFFLARHQVIANQETLAKALEDFRKLFLTILEAEPSELPDLEQEADEFLDALESELHCNYDRGEVKRYLMIRSAPSPASGKA